MQTYPTYKKLYSELVRRRKKYGTWSAFDIIRLHSIRNKYTKKCSLWCITPVWEKYNTSKPGFLYRYKRAGNRFT